MLDFVWRGMSAFPHAEFFLSWMLVLLTVLFASTLIIMVAQIVTDAFSIEHMFDPARFYHLVFVFPVMCLFLLIRFGIQRRDKMEFLVFSFTRWEQRIVQWLGLYFNEDYTEVTYQNMFGAKWEGADCTTTVYRRKLEQDTDRG